MNPVCITVPNVNIALAEGLNMMKIRSRQEASRVGQVARLPVPLITTYLNPKERVLFSPKRNANPFFHFMEALWMLAGRADLSWPVQFNKRFREYSDDGMVIHGAYGNRWRHWFHGDQLDAIVQHLNNNRASRRAVLQMWDAREDLNNPGRDVPCNTQAYFEIVDGKLDMTVCNRSNDLVWGAYGANAVHFSMLQEYMAFRVGAEVGIYRQFSNNAHVYTDVYPRETWDAMILDAQANDHYNGLDDPAEVQPFPLIRSNASTFDRELLLWMSDPTAHTTYREPLFYEVAQPMYMAWQWRDTQPSAAITHAGNIAADDWRMACTDWLNRRQDKKRRVA